MPKVAFQAGPRLARAAPWIALAMALIVVPALNLLTFEVDGAPAPLLSTAAVNQLGRFLCFAIVALGIDLVWGYTGILSLCQALFFCLGGYAMGMHMALHGPLDGDGIPRCLYVVTSEVQGFTLPWFWAPFRTLPVALLLVLLIPGLVAFVFGYFTFRSRVKGVYFSIVTQATTLGACEIFRLNQVRLCGTNGLTNFTELAGFDLNSPRVKLGLYVVTVLVLAGLYVLCRALVQARLGRVLVAIRDNESRLRFSGYRPMHFKVFVFTLGAIIAGIGGMLYAPQTGIVTPFNMEPDKSVVMVVWVALGGRGTLAGAVAGALLMNYAYALLTSGSLYHLFFSSKLAERMSFPELALKHLLGPEGWPFVLGALCLGVVLFFPKGLMGAWSNVTRAAFGAERPPRRAPGMGAALPHAVSGGGKKASL